LASQITAHDKSNDSIDILSAALLCADLKQFRFDEPSIDGTKTIKHNSNGIDFGEPVRNMHSRTMVATAC
jgi:hypothetical protein